MKERKMWLVATIFMVAALLLASCQPAAEGEEAKTVVGKVIEKEGAAAEEAEEEEAEVVAPEDTGPKYGGRLTVRRATSPLDFDQCYRTAWQSYTMDATNEVLTMGDWAKGPLGTNEIPLLRWDDIADRYRKGIVCESWETPDPQTMIFHVRRGVRFHNKSPVNGREMTAEDVQVSIERMFTLPGSWLSGVKNKPTSITATDKYTVELKFAEFDASMLHNRISETIFIVPAEVVRDAEGNETEALRDWENACGTGPWIMTDFVHDSSITFERNPDYWQRDPIHPENRVPYADGLKVLIMPDYTTALSALRTGKLDYLGTGWEDAETLLETSPELRYGRYLDANAIGQWPNLTIEGSPFQDVKVRMAMSMAIDRESLVEEFYGGNAVEFTYFIHPSCTEGYTPFDELPADVQEIYSYNPEKAKLLLAEAGYPNGFQTSTMTRSEDFPALLTSYWADIGVDVAIDVKEYATFVSMEYGHKFEGLVTTGWTVGASLLNSFDLNRSGHYSNWSGISDPYWDEQTNIIVSTLDEAERFRLSKELNEYALRQVWCIPTPTPYYYVFWQPHLRGFEGVFYLGIYHYFPQLAFAWYDE